MMFGIPSLLKKLPRAASLTLFGNSAFAAVSPFFQPPKWGIFKSGTTTPAITVSSIQEFGAAGESAVSDYPIEDGTFSSYNKVIMPNVFMVRLVRDGSESDRAAFLNWLQVTCGSLDLFDVVSPEKTYTNATLKSYVITRSSGSGAAMIIADCRFQEVRQLPAKYSNSKIAKPENQEINPAVRVTPVVESKITAFPLGPLQ